ncbi:MAG: cytochrome c [Acidobacteria bacterium]|nr:cytochrome c [Acidobacteriota bacterium]
MKLGTRVLASAIFLVVGAWTAAPTFQAAEEPDGKRLYMKRCVMCHGRDGKGFAAIKSQDFTDPKWQAAVKDEELFDITKNGKKGTHMPAFGDKLKDDEIRAVVAHLRTFSNKKQ